MNRELLDKWCERGILALVLGILVFAPLAMGAVGTWEFLIVQGLTMGVMLLWGARLWLNPRVKFLWPPICWLVLAFAGYAVYRYANCDIEYVGRREFIQVLVYSFLFLAIVNNLHRQEFTQIISFTLIFLAMAIAGYAIFQFVTKTYKVWNIPSFYPERGTGTYISPNHLAGFLGMLVPLALAYTLAGRMKPVTRILLGYAAAVLLVGIGVTLSRGGFVASGVALLLLFVVLTLHRSHRLSAILLLVVMLGGGLFLAKKSSLLKQRLSKTDTSKSKEELLDVRYSLWEAAFNMWRDHVWLGVGPGHYNYRFSEYRPALAQHRPDHAHNDYLNTLADWGAIGAGLIALALGALFVGVVKCWRYVRRGETEFKSNRSNKFAFVLGASMALVALLVHSCLDFNMHIPANAILAISLAALLSGHLRFATEGYWVSARSWSKLLASLVLGGGLAYLLTQEVRTSREFAWLNRAAQVPEFSPARVNALKNAWAIEPANFDTTYTLAELFRRESFEGGDTYPALAQEAMLWYGRGTNANPHDALNYIGCGMCLDYVGRLVEGERFFQRAVELDPNGFLAAAAMGWHYVQLENWITAKPWLERSLRLEWVLDNNKLAAAYLTIVNERLAASATDQLIRAAPTPQ